MKHLIRVLSLGKTTTCCVKKKCFLLFTIQLIDNNFPCDLLRQFVSHSKTVSRLIIYCKTINLSQTTSNENTLVLSIILAIFAVFISSTYYSSSSNNLFR